jgi:formylglycine-generating enzyme required for sulfatase activity
MARLGLPEGLILAKIRASRTEFDTSPNALLELMNSGIGMSVITLMIEEGAHPSKRAEEAEAAVKESPPRTPPSVLDESHAIGDMVYIEGGCFQMGDTFGEGGQDELPVHIACVDDFYMGRFEVTVGEFREFMEAGGNKTEVSRGDGCYYHNGKKWIKDISKLWSNPGFAQSDRDPVTCISWNDAMEFIKWKSSRDGRKYRLPTEAEWEYTARGGGKAYRFSWGNGDPRGNVADLSLRQSREDWDIWEGYSDGFPFSAPVGSFEPNEFGLYDLTGNVWEWTSDWYLSDYYAKAPQDGPKGPDDGVSKVLRGGAWFNGPETVRTTYRSWNFPALRNFYNGLRLAASVE